MTIAEWVKDVVLRLARVPAEPHVPEGAEGSVRVFNAGRNYFTWRMILWGLGNAAIALGLLIAFAISFIPTLPPLVRAIRLALEAGAVGIFVASIPITYFLQRLNYEMRWYIVTDRSLRIRSGVVWLQEITILCQRSGNSCQCEPRRAISGTGECRGAVGGRGRFHRTRGIVFGARG